MTNIKNANIRPFLAAGYESQIISAHPFPNMGWNAASLWASGVSASFPVCSGLESEKTAARAVAG